MPLDPGLNEFLRKRFTTDARRRAGLAEGDDLEPLLSTDELTALQGTSPDRAIAGYGVNPYLHKRFEADARKRAGLTEDDDLTPLLSGQEMAALQATKRTLPTVQAAKAASEATGSGQPGVPTPNAEQPEPADDPRASAQYTSLMQSLSDVGTDVRGAPRRQVVNPFVQERDEMRAWLERKAGREAQAQRLSNEAMKIMAEREAAQAQAKRQAEKDAAAEERAAKEEERKAAEEKRKAERQPAEMEKLQAEIEAAKAKAKGAGAPRVMSEFERLRLERLKQEIEAGKVKAQAAAEAPDKTATAAEKESWRRATELRKEWNSLADVKNFGEVDTSFQKIKKAAEAPSAAGDIALLTGYMKMIDPGSTVREGEFATAQNAGGVPDRIRAQYNKVVSGERLSSDQRTDFVTQAGNLYGVQKGRYMEQAKRYRDMASGQGIDPEHVTGRVEGLSPAAGGVMLKDAKDGSFTPMSREQADNFVKRDPKRFSIEGA